MYDPVPRASTARSRDSVSAQAARERTSSELAGEFRRVLEGRLNNTREPSARANPPPAGERASSRSSFTPGTAAPEGGVRQTEPAGSEPANRLPKSDAAASKSAVERRAPDEAPERSPEHSKESPSRKQNESLRESRAGQRLNEHELAEARDRSGIAEVGDVDAAVPSSSVQRDEDKCRHDDRASSGSDADASVAPGFVEVSNIPSAQVDAPRDSVAAKGRNAELAHASAELMMADYRRLGFLADRRSWQFTVGENAAFVVDMELDRSANGDWNLRLRMPSGQPGYDREAVSQELAARLGELDVAVRIEIGS